MTSKIGLTASAVVCSAVLFFGNADTAKAHPILGNTVNLATVSNVLTTTPALEELTEIGPPLNLIPAPKAKLDPLTPAVIVTETNAPIVHPVTDPSNSYAWGQCTWYVKNKRPDLPNNLGNANTWYALATAQGYDGSTKPLPGAVGVTTEGAFGHVVFVDSVNADDTINISEMNYAGGIGITHGRTVPASDFIYIY